MATESEIEELQLELVAKVCGLDVDALCFSNPDRPSP